MESVTVKRGTPKDLAALGQMVDRVYRPQKPLGEGMPREFPHLFHPDNAANLFYVEDHGTPVSMVGVLKQTGLVPGAAIPLASVGSVATLPEYRGRHLASVILEEVFRAMAAEERALCLISGGRDLYLRQGAVPVGAMDTVEVDLSPAMPRLSQPLRQVPQEFRSSEAARIIPLYWQEPYRFMRSVEQMQGLLNALWFQRPGYNQQLFTIGPQHQPVAYLVVYVGARAADRGVVMEWAGDRAALVQAVPYVMTHMNIQHLQFHVHRADGFMRRLADEKGWGVSSGPLQGTVKVLSEKALRQAYGAWFAERASLAGEAERSENLAKILFAKVEDGGWELPLMLTDDLNYI